MVSSSGGCSKGDLLNRKVVEAGRELGREHLRGLPFILPAQWVLVSVRTQ